MQCPQCGSENKVEHAKFCAGCGASLSPGAHDTAASDSEGQPSSASAQSYQDKLRHNSFSEFYASGAEAPAWRKRMVVVLTIAASAVTLASVAYYYSHRKYEISELAKLPPVAAETPRPHTASRNDTIFPCPSEAPFCIGTAASKIKDPACAPDKPVWAHYSEDGGNTWKRAGCYATEAQARQGLSDTLGLVGPKTRRLSEPPNKTRESISNRHTPIQASKPATHDETAGSSPQQHHVTFKGPFGIPVEKRNYPSEQMKQKALDLWDREKKILEPDGSINDKYVVKQKIGSGLIPGH